MSGPRVSARDPLRVLLAALALAAVAACGSTVQPSTLSGPGAPAPGGDGIPDDGAGTGLQLPGPQEGPSAGGAADPATGPGAPASVDPGAPAPDSAAGAPPAPDSAAAPGAQPPPQSADRSPLRLGLLYVNNDAASSVGVDNDNSFGPRRVLEAYVAATNARGGLAGRRIQPTYAEIESSSSNYASDLQAACARFVQDAKVGLVMSFLGLTDDQFSACLAKAGLVHVNGSYGLGDSASVAAYPQTVSPQALSADRRSKALLERLTASGHLTRSSRIGVVVEGCPYNQRAYERTLLPTARRLGLDVVETHTTRCFGGINDLSGIGSDAQNAVLRFRAEDVDRVLFVSSVEANVLFMFATAAESQGYRPGYALTSLALANVLKDQIPNPQQQLAQARGVGWLPTMDDNGSLTPTPQAQACVQTVQSKGIAPTSRVDHAIVLAQCDAFALAERVLTASGGATSPRQWGAALSSVGTGLRTAAVLDGRTDFRGGRLEGPAQGRIFAWDSGCSCFRYATGTFPY